MANIKIYQGLNLDYIENKNGITTSSDIDVIVDKLYVQPYVFNTKTFNQLTTSSKNILGSINEINAKPSGSLVSSADISINNNKAFINDSVFQINTYTQLQPVNKTIFGAINEVKGNADDNALNILALRNNKQDKINVDQQSFSLINDFLTLDEPAVSKRFNNTITYDTLDTLDKTITGGINEVVTKTYQLDIGKQDKLVDTSDATIVNNGINLVQRKSYFLTYNLNQTTIGVNIQNRTVNTAWHLSFSLYPTNKAINGTIIHFSNINGDIVESGSATLTDLTVRYLRVTQNVDGTTTPPVVVIGTWNSSLAETRKVVNLAFITLVPTQDVNNIVLSFWDTNSMLQPVNLTLPYQ